MTNLVYCVDSMPPIMMTKHPVGAMMLGVVSSDGKQMLPYWFPEGLKINMQTYLDVLSMHVKPWIVKNYGEDGYVWQQNSAPSHKVVKTQQWCRNNFADFWPWSMWPLSSPDCNPLDYRIWGKVESKACLTPHRSVDDLKSAVKEEWAKMFMLYVVWVCKAFCPRIKAVIAAKGGCFE